MSTEAAASETAAAIRKMLTRMARSHAETPEALFLRYGRERLLCRLSQSEYANRFILKGASLFYAWSSQPHRPTKDIDLLGFGAIDPESVTRIFRAVCTINPGNDGLVFQPETVSAEEIREDSEYGGVRVKLLAGFAGARLHMQIDIGVGDAVVPAAEMIDYPTLLPSLGLEPARLRACPKETVVSEKIQTIVKLGFINSRMKDYYDLAEIARLFTFDGPQLVNSLQATFKTRATTIPPELPIGLADTFANDPTKQTQWQGFLRRNELPDRRFEEIVRSIREFILPPLRAAASAAMFARIWSPGGPWSS